MFKIDSGVSIVSTRITGRCINIGNCEIANSMAVVEVDETAEFVCTECGKPLVASPTDKRGGNKTRRKWLEGVVLVGATAGALAVAFSVASITATRNQHKHVTTQEESLPLRELDTYTQILERGYISFGAQAESPPLNYVEDGKRKGLDYGIMKLIAGQKEFGFTGSNAVGGDINTDNYSDIPSLLKKTDNRGSYIVDVIGGGLTFKDGDIEGVHFTIPYLEGFGYALLVPKGSMIRSLEDLRGKKVGVIDGDPDVNAYASRAAKGATLVSLSDADETWIPDAFTSNKADAIIYDFPFASTETQGTTANIVVSNLPGSKIEYRFGVRKGDQKLLDKLNIAIRRMKETTEYADMLKKFLPTTNIVKPSAEGKKTYTVRAGDSLFSIAAMRLGSADRWRELQGLNNLPNPNFISPGQVIIAPDDFK
jgi:ABC-type amino acid transport substrate-binding protein